MSRHDGVSCDSCLKGNFRGRRYKCLICYDYDLCAACYESGATNTRHTADHPMQCILTRSDFDIYYGGEALSSMELPQSYTCPYCSRMGFTDVTLQEHVTADHQDTNFEVVCPLCAAMPGGDPNLMTDDFAGHLTLEHLSRPRDLISFLDEPVTSRHSVRRIPHNSHSGTHIARGAAAALRPRRSNMHFSVFSSGGLSSLSPSSRESVDPIAELLSQLSDGRRNGFVSSGVYVPPYRRRMAEAQAARGEPCQDPFWPQLSGEPNIPSSSPGGVRRSTSSTSSSTPTQLQQLQMQLQLERQQVNAARQQLERYPRRQTQSQNTLRGESHTSNSGTSTILLNASPVLVQPPNNAPSAPSQHSQFLLPALLEEQQQQSTLSPEERQERARFVQELVYSTAACLSDRDENCEQMFRALMESARATETAETADTNDEEEERPPRQGNTTLRGRARSDNQNAKRRADANRKDKDKR